MVEVRRLETSEIAAAFGDLARLRIEVFRAWPYLYDGDLDYERRYLRAYLDEPRAVVIGAFDGDRLVGAATAAPLLAHHREFAAPFVERGLAPEAIFYFGESVLLDDYRGRGVGVRFFEERERAARQQGLRTCVFSAVIRPDDHPARPAGYSPLDRFWSNRGYARVEGLVTHYSWRDVGEPAETSKPMAFWSKRLDG